MFSNYKFFVIFLVYANICINSKLCGSDFTSDLTASSIPLNQPNILNHRIKRDGGAIPFRPLFVYRAQQKEMRAKWKLIEAQKLLKQQQQKLQSESQQNLVRDYFKHSSIPTKSDYTYRLSPVYPIYQSNPIFPATAQKEKEYASVNSYTSYPTYFRPSYVYQQNPDYDEYYSDY